MTLVSVDKDVEYNGLLLNAPFYPQSFVRTTDVRNSDLARVARSGFVPGVDYLGGCTVTLAYDIVAWDAASFNAAIGAFETAFQLGQTAELPLKFQIPGLAGGGIGLINCRPRKINVPRDDAYFNWATTATVELFATDPLVYSDTLIDVQTALSVPTGGMTFPLTFDLVFGTVGVSGVATVTNAGTAPTAPKFHLVGPVTNPAIKNDVTGQTISLNITLGVGDYLDIDVASRSVVLNGTASRYTALTSAQWIMLTPGANQIRYSASVSTASTLDVIFRSAWL